MFIYLRDTYYNISYIKSIHRRQVDRDATIPPKTLIESLLNRNEKILVSPETIYTVTIANTDSTGDEYQPFYDSVIKISSLDHPDDFRAIEALLQRESNEP